MARIFDDHEFRFRPRAIQIPGGASRAHDVVATLDDYRRNVPDPIHAAEQLVFGLEEPAVGFVVPKLN